MRICDSKQSCRERENPPTKVNTRLYLPRIIKIFSTTGKRVNGNQTSSYYVVLVIHGPEPAIWKHLELLRLDY